MIRRRLAAALLVLLGARAARAQSWGDLPGMPGFGAVSKATVAASTAAVSQSTGALSDDAFLALTRQALKGLVSLDTSNPPGNEIVAARYLQQLLDGRGIPSQIYVSTGTRASLIARLKGSGAKRPLILMCHTDVVPARVSDWATDPFAPTERDGYLYGRGSADIKSMCAPEAAILVWLKNGGLPLSRDVVFFAEADEESGGKERHIDWLLKSHGSELDAEFAINEGGNTVWTAGRVSEVRIQTAEKDYVDFALKTRGQAGHASVPRGDNVVVAVSRAVARIAEYRPAASLDPVVRAFLERQQEQAQAPLRTAIDDALKAAPGPDLERAADNLAAINPEFGAMLRDTIVPTMLSAGYKSNVIPAEAQAVVNVRLLPGHKAQDLVVDLRKVVDDPAIEIGFEPPSGAAVPAMPIDTDLYRAAQAEAAQDAPQARAMPFMAAWTTDSQKLRARGVVVYGIDPPLSEDDGERVHGNNERVNLDALDWYARFLRGIVVRLAAAPSPQAANAR